MTILEVINCGVLFLKDQGVSNPLLSVEFILTQILKRKKVDLYLSSNEHLSDIELNQAQELIKLRGTHYPIQYLLGEAHFYGLEFIVNESVLIPRPETETLVDLVITYIQNNLTATKEISIVDVCTGSGNIAVALAKEISKAKLLALDVSYESLLVADKNIAKHQVREKVYLLNSNLMSAINSNYKCDIIVSNPPYISEDDYASLMKEVKDYEPKIALSDGKDGIDFYRRIICEGLGYLKKGGKFFFEIGEKQANSLEDFIKNIAGVKMEQIVQDYNQKDRVIILNREE